MTAQQPTRRSLLTLAAATAASPVLAGWAAEAAAPDPYALAPDWTAGWRAHRTSKLATIAQIKTGIRIATPDREVQLDPGQLGLWAVRPVAGDFEFRFTYKVLARVASPGGSFGTLYFDTVGEGSAAYPAALSAWKGVTPSDQVYATHARGLRVSFATYNPSNPDIHHKLRLRSFEFEPDGSTSLVGVPSPKLFPFTIKTAYAVVVRRQGTRLTMSVTPKAGGAAQAYAWDDSAIARWGGGQIGFRWRGQDAEITATGLTSLP